MVTVDLGPQLTERNLEVVLRVAGPALVFPFLLTALVEKPHPYPHQSPISLGHSCPCRDTWITYPLTLSSDPVTSPQ